MSDAPPARGFNALPGPLMDQGEIADRLMDELVEMIHFQDDGLHDSLPPAARYLWDMGMYHEGFIAEAIKEAAMSNGRDEERATKEAKEVARRVVQGQGVVGGGPNGGGEAKPKVDLARALTVARHLARTAPPLRESLPIPLGDGDAQMRLWLQTMYRPEDRLAFSVVETADMTRTVADWLRDPPKPQEHGLWVRPNPITRATGANGTVLDGDVCQWRLMVVESDKVPTKEQVGALRALGLHPAYVIRSGGKSMHAGFNVAATDAEEYRTIARGVQHCLVRVGFDASLSNPSRRSRAPGAYRESKGKHQWLEHLDPEAPDITLGTVEQLRAAVEKVEAEAPAALAGANLFVADITESEECAPDMVRGLLTQESLTVLYGASNVGKSFWAYDLAAAIATGRPWRQPVESVHVVQGGVLFIALEGGRGSRNRIRAMRKAGLLDGNPDMALNFTSISLMDPACVLSVRDMVLEWRATRGTSPVLIILDTLSRAFGGGNENSPDDMGLAVIHMDKIRAMTKAALLPIHHSGKDEAKGARGHSSLRAASDTEIELFRNEGEKVITAVVKKQRDIPERDPMPFELESMVLYQDSAGFDVTSCVVRHLPVEEAGTKDAVAKRKEGEKKSEDERDYAAALACLPQPSQVAWCKSAGFGSAPTFSRFLKRVANSGFCQHFVAEGGEIRRSVDALPTLEEGEK